MVEARACTCKCIFCAPVGQLTCQVEDERQISLVRSSFINLNSKFVVSFANLNICKLLNLKYKYKYKYKLKLNLNLQIH